MENNAKFITSKKEIVIAYLDRIAQVSGFHLNVDFLREGEIELDESHQDIYQFGGQIELKLLPTFDEVEMPLLAIRNSEIIGILKSSNILNSEWMLDYYNEENNSFSDLVVTTLEGLYFVKVRNLIDHELSRFRGVVGLVVNSMRRHRPVIVKVMLIGFVMNLISLAISLYSMQVYDRVVPTGSLPTLIVLSLGVVFAIIFELIARLLKSGSNELLMDAVDKQLTREVFARLLSVRLDQMPKSVGSMAAQVRGYESIRNLLIALAGGAIIDIPFAVLFVLIVYAISGWLAIIPSLFLLIALFTGFFYKARIDYLSQQSNIASNKKTGILVEVIEGIETIKSGNGGWTFLSKWLNISNKAREEDREMRHVTEHSQYLVMAIQQISYVTIVAVGSVLITKGQLTMGGLIACSILSGRILAPIASIPGYIIQWGQAKAAANALNALWGLEDDHSGVKLPISLCAPKGNYQFENVGFSYANSAALTISDLKINQGEKIAILGPIGSGKTTLLRLLTGMYKPQLGKVLFDSVDISHISKPALSGVIGYLQQEGRLFAGSLRDNLIIGAVAVNDDSILNISTKTGLIDLVVRPHDHGLMQEISEGGQGLSGGQKQLISLTRLFLQEPKIWLLDEPTASIDKGLEVKILNLFKETLSSDDTLVLVTHKYEMLELVNRVIVVANGSIILDGPKHDVLNQLRQGKSNA